MQRIVVCELEAVDERKTALVNAQVSAVFEPEVSGCSCGAVCSFSLGSAPTPPPLFALSPLGPRKAPTCAVTDGGGDRATRGGSGTDG